MKALLLVIVAIALLFALAGPAPAQSCYCICYPSAVPYYPATSYVAAPVSYSYPSYQYATPVVSSLVPSTVPATYPAAVTRPAAYAPRKLRADEYYPTTVYYRR